MPYQQRRKRVYKKKPVASASRWATYGAAALGVAQIARDVSMLKGLVNTEFKAITGYASLSPSTTGNLTLLNGLQTGDTSGIRDGSSVRFKSLALNLRAYSAAGGVYRTVMRFLIVLDTQPNAATPAISDILDTQGGTIELVQAHRNLANRKRFVILKDKHHSLNDYQSGVNQMMYKVYKKLDFHTIYNSGNAGTIADITSNSLYLLECSASSANLPTFNAAWRLRFVDN